LEVIDSEGLESSADRIEILHEDLYEGKRGEKGIVDRKKR